MNYAKHRTKEQRELIQDLKIGLPMFLEVFKELQSAARMAIVPLPATSEHGLPVVHACNQTMYNIEGAFKDALWALTRLEPDYWEIEEA